MQVLDATRISTFILNASLSTQMINFHSEIIAINELESKVGTHSVCKSEKKRLFFDGALGAYKLGPWRGLHYSNTKKNLQRNHKKFMKLC